MSERGRLFAAELMTVTSSCGTVPSLLMSFEPSGFVRPPGTSPISGCHINPAVTVGLWIAGKTTPTEIPWYFGGQIIAGSRRVGHLPDRNSITLQREAIGLGVEWPARHSPGGFDIGLTIATEIVFTGLFIFVITESPSSPGHSDIG